MFALQERRSIVQTTDLNSSDAFQAMNGINKTMAHHQKLKIQKCNCRVPACHEIKPPVKHIQKPSSRKIFVSSAFFFHKIFYRCNGHKTTVQVVCFNNIISNEAKASPQCSVCRSHVTSHSYDIVPSVEFPVKWYATICFHRDDSPPNINTRA
ncbi:uncharacterized protein LOC134186160 [Corticium candelabrum]|uniref:uncharacterized protein LOC134186160 n=1 Tax=Corticium candelabrum TaxID=121492 RepID=UPI002E25911A|nr:uncharacterized protein LOC134186160 [Corticium candelabrum]